MTEREIFDTVKAHLLKQRCRSADEDMYCLYRGPNGTKCAIGCLIPDELYDPFIEGKPFNAFKHLLEKCIGDITLNKSHLLLKLQFIHDYALVDIWPERLDKLEKGWEFQQ